MFCFCELRVVCGCEGIQSHPRQSSTTAILTKSTIQHVQNVVNFSKFFFLLFLRLFRFSANSNWKVVRGRNLFAIDKRDRIWLFLCVSYSRDRWSEKTLKKNKINQNVCVRGKGSCVCVCIIFISFVFHFFSIRRLPFHHSGFKRCHWTTAWRGLVIMSCQCLVSDAPVLFLPANTGKRDEQN